MLARLQACSTRAALQAARVSTVVRSRRSGGDAAPRTVSRTAMREKNTLTDVFASLMGSHVGGALLGLVFWILAAHTFTPAQVGIGAALVAAMTLLSELALLGVDTLLLERFKFVSVGDRWALFVTGLVVTAGAGALIALAGLAVLRLIRPAGVMGDLSSVDAVLLVLATVIAAVCAVFDQAAIGMGAGAVQLWRNLCASVLRVGVLVGATVLQCSNGYLILVAWIVGMVGSLAVCRLQRTTLPRSAVTGRDRLRLVRAHWTTALGHHGLTLAMGTGALMLPVVVAALIPAEETAYFVQARLLSDTALALPFLLTVALFATAVDIDEFRRTARYTICLGMAFALFLIGGAALLGRALLMLFGSQYANASLPLLLILLCTGPVLVIKDHFAVLRRLQGKRISGAVAMALWAAAELSGAIVGGLTGSVLLLCVGWLVMSAASALVALPVLVSGMRRPIMVAQQEDSSPAERADRRLAEFWTSYVESGIGRYHYAAWHPLRCLSAIRAIRQLPVVCLATPSARPGGVAVQRVLDLRGPGGVPARWLGSAALAVPADAAEYQRGPHARTLRRKIRAADRHGIRCRLVPHAERITMVAQCNSAEQRHRQQQYRVRHPHNDDLLQHDLWLVAEDVAGRALLLAVLPVDGDVATLRYFRTLGAGEVYSLSRYVGTQAVVTELSRRGVRWLLDTAPPGAQTNGVRHFQRMVGFRYVRLAIASPVGAAPVPAESGVAVHIEHGLPVAGMQLR
ncbi:O-antigen/teichoic acid export membrane protein [Mycobacterium sp. MAA66]